MDLDTLGLLAGLSALTVVGAYLWQALRPPRPPPAEARPTVLLDALRWDPAAQNQILTLGADRAAPALLEELTAALQDPSLEPEVAARAEQLLADFGLAALPAVFEALAAHLPHTAQAASLARILLRQGPRGLQRLVEAALKAPGLAAHLPGLLAAAPDRARLLAAALAARPLTTRGADLAVLSGSLVANPEALPALWAASPEGRPALLGWLAEWPPLAPPALITAALAEPDCCAAAARIAGLMPPAPALRAALEATARSGPPACRAAALWALGADPAAGLALRAGLADPEPTVAYAAATAWAPRPELDPAAPAPALPAAQRAILGGDLDAALAGLEAPDEPTRCLAVLRCAASLDRDLRVRERLIRRADAGPMGRDRIAAVEQLGRAGEAPAAEWLFACVRHARDGDLPWLQRAAQAIHAPAARPLARRIPGEPAHRQPTLLAVLRCLPLETAAPALLRLLGGARPWASPPERAPARGPFGALEGLAKRLRTHAATRAAVEAQAAAASASATATLCATLALGGLEVRAVIERALAHPGQGLSARSLRYLARHPDPSLLPAIGELLQRQPPLRAMALDVIEGYHAAAVPALEALLEAGGDDDCMRQVEARLARLRACLEPPA